MYLHQRRLPSLRENRYSDIGIKTALHWKHTLLSRHRATPEAYAWLHRNDPSWCPSQNLKRPKKILDHSCRFLKTIFSWELWDSHLKPLRIHKNNNLCMENALFYLSFSPKPRFLPILMFSLVYLPPYKKRSTSSVARIIPSANLLFCSFFFFFAFTPFTPCSNTE